MNWWIILRGSEVSYLVNLKIQCRIQECSGYWFLKLKSPPIGKDWEIIFWIIIEISKRFLNIRLVFRNHFKSNHKTKTLIDRLSYRMTLTSNLSDFQKLSHFISIETYKVKVDLRLSLAFESVLSEWKTLVKVYKVSPFYPCKSWPDI